MATGYPKALAAWPPALAKGCLGLLLLQSNLHGVVEDRVWLSFFAGKLEACNYLRGQRGVFQLCRKGKGLRWRKLLCTRDPALSIPAPA